MSYQKEYLLQALASLLDSAGDRLNYDERELLGNIYQCIAKTNSEAELEKQFFELLKWFVLIMEVIKNSS